MMKTGVGISYGPDSHAVGEEAAQMSLEGFGVVQPDFVIVFASVEYDQKEVIRGVRSLIGNALLVGSSTAGEITTQGPAQRHSVVVMAISSDDFKFFADVGEDIKSDAIAAGRQVADRVKEKAGEPLSLFMMFPDILVGNGADIVRGVLQSLGKNFPVVGGASGDDFKFEKTYQYLNDKVYSGSVVGVGFMGDVKFGIGVNHGWTPIGTPLKVTKSEGAVVHEIDGKPAISVYEEHFGKDNIEELRTTTLAKLAITYPLGMHVENSDELLIRNPITVDEYGSITCAAEIPEGSIIRLMVGDSDSAIEVARAAAHNAMEQIMGAEPSAVIIFSSIARSKLFGDQRGDEIKAIQEVVGSTMPLIGFYTYGEQAPLSSEVQNLAKCNPVFHNETVVILVLGG